MFKKKIPIYFILFLAGLSAGVLFGISKLNASSPEGETSGGITPATVNYDEFWKATGALISNQNGYVDFDPSTQNNSLPAGSIKVESGSNDDYVEIFPKMVVTKWKVHGHIHFE